MPSLSELGRELYKMYLNQSRRNGFRNGSMTTKRNEGRSRRRRRSQKKKTKKKKKMMIMMMIACVQTSPLPQKKSGRMGKRLYNS